jgi:hypothetical protein
LACKTPILTSTGVLSPHLDSALGRMVRAAQRTVETSRP